MPLSPPYRLALKSVALGVLGVFILSIICLWAFPEKLFEKALSLAGLPDSRIETVDWSPQGSVLKNISLPAQGLTIDTLTAYALPADIICGRLAKIVIDGIHYQPSPTSSSAAAPMQLSEMLRGLDLRSREIMVTNGRMALGGRLPPLLVTGSIFENGNLYQATYKLATPPDQSDLQLDATGKLDIDTATGLLKGQADIAGEEISLHQLSMRRLGGWINFETTAASDLPVVNAQLAAGVAEVMAIPFTDVTLSVAGDMSRLQAVFSASLARTKKPGSVTAEAIVTRNENIEQAAIKLDVALPDLEALAMPHLKGRLSVKGSGTIEKAAKSSYGDLAAYHGMQGELAIDAAGLSSGTAFQNLDTAATLSLAYDTAGQKIILTHGGQPLRAAVTLAGQDWKITLPGATASYAPLLTGLDLEIKDAEAQMPGLVLSGLAVDVSALLKPHPVAEGRITVANITSTAKLAAFTPLKLDLGLQSLSSAQYTTGFEGSLTGQSGALMIKAQGTHDSAKKTGRLRVRLEPLNLQPGVTTLDEFFPASRQYVSDISGQIAAFGGVNWQHDGTAWQTTSRGRIKLENLAGAYAGEFPFTGLNTVIALDSLMPAAFSRQQVAIGAFTAGLPLQNGLVTLSLKNGKDLTLHDGIMDMAGGKVTVAPFTLDLNKRTGRITLGAGGLDLEKLFAIAPMEGLSASGEVDGTLPLVLTDGGIALDNGVLQSTGPGVLKYAPQQLPSFLKDDTNEHIVTLRTAIANFNFSNLRMGLNGDLLGDQTITLTIEGKNPDFYGGHPVKLNLNVEGPLQNILRYAPGTSTIPDTIEKQLEQFEENNALSE